MHLDILTIETAPEELKDHLEEVQRRYSFVPNLMGVMANAPPLLKAYLSLNALFDQTSLSPLERQIVILATSVANGCEYCVAAHSAAAKMQQVPADIVQSIRENRRLADLRWEALRSLTTEIVLSRGWPAEKSTDEFLAAGFEPHQVLEVILGVTMKTLSNYTNHVVGTPLDPQFMGARWTATAVERA